MTSIGSQQIDWLQQALSDFHELHEREKGPMSKCRESTCVEAKLGLAYLAPKAGQNDPQDSASDSFSLK